MTSTTIKAMVIALVSLLAAASTSQAQTVPVNFAPSFNKQIPLGKHNGAPLVNFDVDVPLNTIFNFGNNNKSGIINGGGSMGLGGDTFISQNQLIPTYPNPGNPWPSPSYPTVGFNPNVQTQNAGAVGNGTVTIMDVGYGGGYASPQPIMYSPY